MKTKKWMGFFLLISSVILSGCSNGEITGESPETDGESAGAAADFDWMTDYEAALARAEAEEKPILMNFTGSDWCPPCQLMQKEVFSTEEFREYAAENLVLLELDYPIKLEQSKEVVEQNKVLQGQFDIEVFPTFVILQPNGDEEKRTTGYREGGPSTFIDWIRS